MRLVAALALLSAVLCSQDRPLLVRAGVVLPMEGAPVPDGAVLVRDGRIAAVGDVQKLPEGTEVVDLPDGVLLPGLIDAGCYLGAYAHRNEATTAAAPDLRIADALDPLDPDIARARRAGVTMLHLMPGDADVIGGRTAVVKVAPGGGVRWLRRQALLKCSLASGRWQEGRAPTHVLGGVELIGRHRAHAAVAPLWSEGCLVAAQTAREIDVATSLEVRLGLRPLLLCGAAVVEHASHLRGAVRGVVLDPLLPEATDRHRRAAARLAAAGIPFAFASRAPARPPEVLRLSAVTARMGGLDPEAAHRALTLDAARLLGVDDRVGSLRPGKDADLAAFSRDPTDPRARVLLVVQDGRVVRRAPDETPESRR